MGCWNFREIALLFSIWTFGSGPLLHLAPHMESVLHWWPSWKFMWLSVTGLYVLNIGVMHCTYCSVFLMVDLEYILREYLQNFNNNMIQHGSHNWPIHISCNYRSSLLNISSVTACLPAVAHNKVIAIMATMVGPHRETGQALSIRAPPVHSQMQELMRW